MSNPREHDKSVAAAMYVFRAFSKWRGPETPSLNLPPAQPSTHVDGFRPDRPKPKKPGFRPKKLRKNRK